MALTNTAILNAKPSEKPYKIYDTDGLFMQVTPAGGNLEEVKIVDPEFSLSEAEYNAIVI